MLVSVDEHIKIQLSRLHDVDLLIPKFLRALCRGTIPYPSVYGRSSALRKTLLLVVSFCFLFSSVFLSFLMFPRCCRPFLLPVLSCDTTPWLAVDTREQPSVLGNSNAGPVVGRFGHDLQRLKEWRGLLGKKIAFTLNCYLIKQITPISCGNCLSL